MSKIPWTEKTWNPITGCTPISDGCKNCYAVKMAKRLQTMGLAKYKEGFNVKIHKKEDFQKPIKWKKPCMIFVCSMGDIFHNEVEDEAILMTYRIMQFTGRHTYQVLTKRPERGYRDFLHQHGLTGWPPNVWLGVTVENNKTKDRLYPLVDLPKTQVHFVSHEPLLERIKPSQAMSEVDWAIIGGESGPGAREMKREWAEELVEFYQAHDIPVFFKQFSRQEGKHYREFASFPDKLKVREYPDSAGYITRNNK